MVKVVTSKEMGQIEQRAYQMGCEESVFMERAGEGVFEAVIDYILSHDMPPFITLICGKGNNAGDAYVAGQHFIKSNYTVFAIQVVPIESCSLLCQAQASAFEELGGSIVSLEEAMERGGLPNGVVVDALFGTGFHGRAREPFATAIGLVNQSGLPVISVDIPSGVDGETGAVEGEAVIATETCYLELPKKGFFFQEGWKHVGTLVKVPFGLPLEMIEQQETDLILLSQEEVSSLKPPIVNDRYKYQAGLVVGLAGSPGMPGAALLSSKAALRAGAGIVRLLHPQGMEAELASSPYELIKIGYSFKAIKEVAEEMNRAKANFLGPGIGRSPEMRQFLKRLLPLLEKPCVIDADALTLIAEEGLAFPKLTLITPHRGEMGRLLKIEGHVPVTSEYLAMCQAYVEQHGVTLVLKGGCSFIFHPKKTIRINALGSPGMATAGTGDVLTGLLAALLAQGLDLHEAAQLGVYLHGYSGKLAAEELTPYCLNASDLIDYFPEVFG